MLQRLGYSISADRPIDEIDIFGKPSLPLTRAVQFLAAHIHPVIEAQTRCEIGYSRRACILASLVAKDVLRGLGIGATAAPAIFRLQKRQRGQLVNDFFIGQPDMPNIPGMWNAHMVVLADGCLLDFTLLQARRPRWPHLPSMVAAPVRREGKMLEGRFPRLLGLGSKGEEIKAFWFDNPTKTDWRARSSERRQCGSCSRRRVSAI